MAANFIFHYGNTLVLFMIFSIVHNMVFKTFLLQFSFSPFIIFSYKTVQIICRLMGINIRNFGATTSNPPFSKIEHNFDIHQM